MAFSVIQPYQYVAIRLPSDQTRVEQMLPNTLINLGKYGSFRTNQIIGRPYHLTFEILDRSEVKNGKELRVVQAAELHAMALVEQAETDGEVPTPANEPDELAVSQQPTTTTTTTTTTTPKSNVNTHDDPTNQKLTMAEIETLKRNTMGSGRELIEKIMQSHSTLDQKTAFSLAKYTLRKHKKYMKQFTVLPLDVSTLVDWMMADREFAKVMEMRNEVLGLVGCWANVHAAGQDSAMLSDMDPYARYLVVDDTGGLLVAAMAERMGILHPTDIAHEVAGNPEDEDVDDEQPDETPTHPLPRKPYRERYRRSAMSATSNTITLVHANQQPNLGLLRYFNFDSNAPTASHPLYTNMKTLSWLQLLEPESAITYQEPPQIPDAELARMKSNRRSAYYRKRRRWERVRNVVNETQAGGFSGLIVASFADPSSTLHHLVPLLAGGSQVVVYSPNVEPLVELADCYSTARRAAFINTPLEQRTVPSKDFPVDPTLLLAPTVHTARVRKWQVLPGRTHPLMTSRGGAEGYIFVGTRVVPAEGKVEARGRPPRGKKIKADDKPADSPVTGELEEGKRAADDEEQPQSPLKKLKVEIAAQEPDGLDAPDPVVNQA
ncbi:hypothetical protein AYO20_02552 [Fonsecaea nubica]|uniref:tRNA (adenine(58)-N(1))-methyltransferase non-catalytic subunit TRM6 n=1 Tax=Fonsecaea nubica TaxID=856822 RepID=A0A178D796_9EURO|nr:hypothetical protein AYO20_02552 [Fonsecaea nubica]OAL38100.1 hypothetical protein AYO20_02552 [Fonsecaea nubica]